jgi:hypothetical protein
MTENIDVLFATVQKQIRLNLYSNSRTVSSGLFLKRNEDDLICCIPKTKKKKSNWEANHARRRWRWGKGSTTRRLLDGRFR